MVDLSILKKNIINISELLTDIKSINARKGKSPFEYKCIAKNISKICTTETCKQNDFYYNAYHLKKFCQIPNKYIIKASIEHGVPYDDNGYWEADINTPFNNIITFGEYRKEVLSRVTNKNIIEIGMPFAYAESYWPEKDIKEMKEKYKKTLLIFPSHSTTQVNVSFDIDLFIKTINEIAKDFDSVFICLYWKDVLLKRYERYEKEGYTVLSAGHIYDKEFLPRLKGIIQLSDAVVSNEMGSYIGQAVLLNKPVYLVPMKCEATCEEAIYLEEYLGKGVIHKKIFDTFNRFTGEISQEQRRICEYIWGLDKIKSQKELRDILLNLE